jgi:hypothetical protein
MASTWCCKVIGSGGLAAPPSGLRLSSTRRESSSMQAHSGIELLLRRKPASYRRARCRPCVRQSPIHNLDASQQLGNVIQSSLAFKRSPCQPLLASGRQLLRPRSATGACKCNFRPHTCHTSCSSTKQCTVLLQQGSLVRHCPAPVMLRWPRAAPPRCAARLAGALSSHQAPWTLVRRVQPSCRSGPAAPLSRCCYYVCKQQVQAPL